MNDRHISDDRLIDVCLTSPCTPGEQAHLAICGRCEARRNEIISTLAEIDDAASTEAGAVFPDAKLERQHTRILQRVDHDGRPGRLVTFPVHPASSGFLMPSRPRVRWAAAVAAVAFLAGLFTGQWSHNLTGLDIAPSKAVGDGTDQPIRAVPTTFSEEEFLGQVELAASRNGPAALRPLDAMTPRAGDVR